MNIRASLFLALLLSAGLPVGVRGQTTGGRAFDLGTLQQAAVDTDPRARELQLFMQQSDLRLRNISALRLPTVTFDGYAQYQSDVAHLNTVLPGVGALFLPPKDTFDAGIRVDQRLFDATVGAQRALEQAQLVENQARVRSTLYPLRQQVNDAFFAAAAVQARAGALMATIDDLTARLQETNARVQQGTALPADAAAIEATLLQRQQDLDEVQAGRRGALDRLGTLTGLTFAETDMLTIPDLRERVAAARQAEATLRARPEYEQFQRTRERITRQQALSAAQDGPRLSAYGRAGYGKPGLNFAQSEFESYALAGVRLQWNAWTWGSGAREREALALQQQIASADEEAFARGLDAATDGDETAIDRLERSLAADERIVMLREQVARSAQIRLQEGVVTASEYLDRTAELLQARFARAGHEVELAQVSARLLTTLGLEVR
jgi:outer membrane protein TolC